MTNPLDHEHVANEPQRRVTAAVATLLVGLSALLAVSHVRSTGTTDLSAAASTDAILAPPVQQLACGDRTPMEVAVPLRFLGPISAPSGHAIRQPALGQLVLTWASATGHVEVRWPADAHNNPFIGDQGGADTDETRTGNGVLGAISPTAEPAGNGRLARHMIFLLPTTQSDNCNTIQISVQDTDLARVDSAVEEIERQPFQSSVPLVVGQESPRAMPSVVPCSTPAGSPPSANRGAELTGPARASATPDAALAAFLSESPSLLQRGWVMLSLPDGSVAYGNSGYGGQPGYVTVVHMGAAPDGWTARSWEASGC